MQKNRRLYDTLHHHTRIYQTNHSPFSFTINDRENEHGNAVPKLENRYHYHHGMKAGVNRLGAQFIRILMHSVIHSRRYVPYAF